MVLQMNIHQNQSLSAEWRLDVGKLRAKEGSPLAEVWLLGKLL
jgi:hypothetical protein